MPGEEEQIAASDHEILLIIAGVTVFFLLFAIGLIVFVVVYYNKQRAFRREKEQAEAQYREALIRTQQEVRTELLQNVSDEIHDNLGQVASLIKIYVNTLQVDHAQSESHQELRNLVNRLIYDLKTLSLNTRPDYITQAGLIDAMETDLNRLEASGMIRIRYEKNMEEFTLHNDLQLIVYRLFQESVNNVIKHAQATEIQVQLISDRDHFAFHLRDNGKGFDPAAIPGNENGKSGIANMYRRSGAIGGDLSIQSDPEGTSILFTLNHKNSPV